ncbi:MAG TPA: hypothetical protein VM282_02305 [Acidimicrobiales bacterium]|nr:hypothetical protein [Acidimicrobiales bacterium]
MAVLALVVAAVALDGGGAGQRAVPASTIAPSTVVASTVVPTTTVPATAPATTATVRVPRTTAGVAPGPGPVLGEPSGWTVVAFDSVTLSLLDLDTGATTRFAYDGRFHSAADSAIMLSDRFVYTDHGGAPTVWSQRYGDEAPTLVQQDATIITASSVRGRLWVALNQSGVNGELLVAEIDSEGRRSSTLTIPNGLRVVGSSAVGLWLAGSGRIYSLSAVGTLQAIAVGSVVDASPAGALYDDCAIAGPCTLRLAGATAQSARIGPSAEIRIATTNDSTDSVLSPDGRWLLLRDGLLDRRTGTQVGHSFVLRAWRWSPDGEWLFAWTANTGTIAWRLADTLQIRLGDISVSGVVAR